MPYHETVVVAPSEWEMGTARHGVMAGIGWPIVVYHQANCTHPYCVVFKLIYETDCF
jgi:hypothetical protein